jgi:hypothetical protein
MDAKFACDIQRMKKRLGKGSVLREIQFCNLVSLSLEVQFALQISYKLLRNR